MLADHVPLWWDAPSGVLSHMLTKESKTWRTNFPLAKRSNTSRKQGSVSLYTVTKQMPQEDGQFAFKYRIKNEQEGFERNVWEYDLTVADQSPNLYSFVKKLRHSGHH